jgi:hypothetical protein
MAGKLLLAALLLSLAPRWPCSPQSIEENLFSLESLIDKSLSSIESMESDNEALKKTLASLEASLTTQSLLLREQGQLLSEQEASYAQRRRIYEAQERCLEALQFKSKAYKWSLIVAAPVCAGLGAWLGWALASR